MKNNQKIISETTLIILKKKSWSNISLDEIKKKSKIKSFNKLIKKKQDILKGLNNFFDYRLSLAIKNIEQSTNKDMIFEILMMRFDILQSYRNEVISIFNSFKTKPKELVFFMPDLLDSIIFMLGHTNLSIKGITGQLKIKGVLIIYISTFFVWMNDQTYSLEKTMTSLDDFLDQANKIIDNFT